MERAELIQSAHVATVLRLGDARLRRIAQPVLDFSDPAFVSGSSALVATLGEFRRRNGFGRAIAAPQIGIAQRFIAVDLGDGPFLVVNPHVVERTDDIFTMWDDCMSFPDLLVKVARHTSISFTYQDETGTEREWSQLKLAESELLQHEIDHLDGILAVDRALDRESLVWRSVFDERRTEFEKLVDYTIGAGRA